MALKGLQEREEGNTQRGFKIFTHTHLSTFKTAHTFKQMITFKTCASVILFFLSAEDSQKEFKRKVGFSWLFGISTKITREHS